MCHVSRAQSAGGGPASRRPATEALPHMSTSGKDIRGFFAKKPEKAGVSAHPTEHPFLPSACARPTRSLPARPSALVAGEAQGGA